MKKIYRLVTTYQDETTEVNGFFRTEEGADRMLAFIMKNSPVGDKYFKKGNITAIEVSDNTEKIVENGQEWLVI